jgi:hypothetical protein
MLNILLMKKHHKPVQPDESATLREAISFLSDENVKAYKIIERLTRKCDYLLKIVTENKSEMLKKTGIIITVILRLLLPEMIMAQEPVLKKANTIVISDTLSQQQYFSKISDILFESGYGILSSDKAQGTITTTEKPYKHGVMSLTFLIKDKRVLVRGQFNMGISVDYGGVQSQSQPTTIQNFGMKSSPSMVAWNEMMKITAQIPGEKEYQIK